jgi:hypothetical protein
MEKIIVSKGEKILVSKEFLTEKEERIWIRVWHDEHDFFVEVRINNTVVIQQMLYKGLPGDTIRYCITELSDRSELDDLKRKISQFVATILK